MSGEPRRMIIDAAAVAAGLVGARDVASAWGEPSALEGMTVGALAAHLVRATGATLAYLDRTDPSARPEGELLTRHTYFRAAIEAPIHERIREVSAREAAAGVDEVVVAAHRVAADLAERLPSEPADRLVGALGGRMLTLDEFCRTRCIEIGMHIDDLAHSVGLPTPALPDGMTAQVIEILTGIARDRHGDWPVIHALGRHERLSETVFPVL